MFRYIKVNAFEFGNHRFNPTYGTYGIERVLTKVTLRFIGTHIVEVSQQYDTSKEAVLAVSCLSLALRARGEDADIIRGIESLMERGEDKVFKDIEYATYYHCAETLHAINGRSRAAESKLEAIALRLNKEDTPKKSRGKGSGEEKPWVNPIRMMELD